MHTVVLALALAGGRPPRNLVRGGDPVKISERSTASQRALLKNAQRRANEKRTVRNWNTMRDGGGSSSSGEGVANDATAAAAEGKAKAKDDGVPP